MHEFPYPAYLATHRDTWRLSQPELGFLLGGYSASTICKYERVVHAPNAEVLVGVEFIFGEPARQIFPAFYSTVEVAVTKRAARMAEALVGHTGKKADAKRALLEAIAQRAARDL
jgi:hypothetical protein